MLLPHNATFSKDARDGPEPLQWLALPIMGGRSSAYVEMSAQHGEVIEAWLAGAAVRIDGAHFRYDFIQTGDVRPSCHGGQYVHGFLVDGASAPNPMTDAPPAIVALLELERLFGAAGLSVSDEQAAQIKTWNAGGPWLVDGNWRTFVAEPLRGAVA